MQQAEATKYSGIVKKGKSIFPGGVLIVSVLLSMFLPDQNSYKSAFYFISTAGQSLQVCEKGLSECRLMSSDCYVPGNKVPGTVFKKSGACELPILAYHFINTDAAHSVIPVKYTKQSRSPGNLISRNGASEIITQTAGPAGISGFPLRAYHAEILSFEILFYITLAVLLITIYRLARMKMSSHQKNNDHGNEVSKPTAEHSETDVVLSMISEAVIVTDPHGNITGINKAAGILTGLSHVTPGDVNIAGILTVNGEAPDFTAFSRNSSDENAAELPVCENNGEIIVPGREIVPVAVNVFSLKKDGKLTLVFLLKDLTDLKEKEKEAAGTKALFHSLFEDTAAATAILRLPDLVFEDASRSFCRLFGLDKEKCKDKNKTIFNLSGIPPQLIENLREITLNNAVPAARELKFNDSTGNEHFGVLDFIETDAGSGYLVLRITDITELKKSKDAAVSFAGILESMIKYLPFDFWARDLNEKMFIQSNEGKKMWGNLLSHNLNDDFVNESNIKRWRENNIKAFAGEVVTGETSYTTINGSTRYFYEVIAPYFIDGRVSGILGINLDITESKKAEIATRLSEEKFRTIFNSANEGICLTDLNDIISEVNPKFLEMLGYEHGELTGQYFDDLIVPEERNEQTEVNRRRKEGISGTYERRLIRKDGRIISTFISASPVYGSDSKYSGSLGMITDITERKMHLEEITKFSKAVEKSSASIVITDKHGNIEYVNARFCLNSGYSKEEAIGKNVNIVKSGQMSPDVYKDLWETIKNGDEWTGEMLNKKKTGEFYWELLGISSIKNEKGEITNYVGVKEDISYMKNLVHELEEARKKAEDINRLKAIFFANMSHELRTPFIGILGYTEILLESLTDDEERKMAEAILRSSERLKDTLNKILDLTKLEITETVVELLDTDVYYLILDVAELFDKAAQNKGLYIKISNKAGDTTIKTDQKILREVIENLISNAVKYTLSGGIEIDVTSETRTLGTYLKVMVKDTGIGIPEDKLDIIWEEFRQVSEGYGRNYEGTGLGLTITKKYVELLGGKIEVQSRPGTGSVFTLLLPMF